MPGPVHITAPGAHTPWHTPETHAELTQGTAVLQAPVAPHVCTPLPEHCLAPGTQTPVHAPDTHAELTQGTAMPHAPDAAQVCTPLPEHCVMPVKQKFVHCGAPQDPAKQTCVTQDPFALHQPYTAVEPIFWHC